MIAPKVEFRRTRRPLPFSSLRTENQLFARDQGQGHYMSVSLSVDGWMMVL